MKKRLALIFLLLLIVVGSCYIFIMNRIPIFTYIQSIKSKSIIKTLNGTETFITIVDKDSNVKVAVLDTDKFKIKKIIENATSPCWNKSKTLYAVLKASSIQVLDRKNKVAYNVFCYGQTSVEKIKWLGDDSLILYCYNDNLGLKYLSFVYLSPNYKYKAKIYTYSIDYMPLCVAIDGKMYYIIDLSVSEDLQTYSAIVSDNILNSKVNRKLLLFKTKDIKNKIDLEDSFNTKRFLDYNMCREIDTVDIPENILLSHNGKILSYTTVNTVSLNRKLFLYYVDKDKNKEVYYKRSRHDDSLDLFNMNRYKQIKLYQFFNDDTKLLFTGDFFDAEIDTLYGSNHKVNEAIPIDTIYFYFYNNKKIVIEEGYNLSSRIIIYGGVNNNKSIVILNSYIKEIYYK